MSTVVVATVKSNSSSPPAFQNTSGTEIGTLCRAWVNFNGTGTVAIRAQFNVSSITDNGVGSYTVNFSSALTDANYVCVVAAANANDSVNINPPTGVDRSSSSVRIDIETDGGTPQFDADLIDVAIFR